jgi:citrate synthase
MDALRMGVGALGMDDYGDERATGIALLAYTPLIVGAYWRLLQGKEVVTGIDEGNVTSLSGIYLHALTGTPPTPAQIHALDTYLVTVIEHGLNASTFTARVIISTQSDLISAVTGAIGALKGPLHGGAPGPALDMVFEIGTGDCAEPYLRAKLGRGERLMGFGHRVYKVRDPRAEVLAEAAKLFYHNGNDMALYDLATTVEATAVRLLAEIKPGRNLQTNVEFYTALLLHGLGLDSDLFSPTFAVARMGGWLAHCFEQMGENVLFRPNAHYVGDRKTG